LISNSSETKTPSITISKKNSISKKKTHGLTNSSFLRLWRTNLHLLTTYWTRALNKFNLKHILQETNTKLKQIRTPSSIKIIGLFSTTYKRI